MDASLVSLCGAVNGIGEKTSAEAYADKGSGGERKGKKSAKMMKVVG